MSDVLQRVHKIVGDITTDAFEDGRRQERARILEVIEEEIKKIETTGTDSTLEGAATLSGLKKAQLKVKELKWT